MKSIFEKMYNGEICPAERPYPECEKYRKEYAVHARHCQDFEQKLSQIDPALYREFTKILDEVSQVQSMDMFGTFVDGFSLGTRMMIEVFQKAAQES